MTVNMIFYNIRMAFAVFESFHQTVNNHEKSLISLAFAETGKRVAKDDAEMQADDPTMPTRLPPENGTKILLHFGDTVIPGVLNNSETARALIHKKWNRKTGPPQR